MQGDSIYNGAHDNASGTGIMLEVARAFTRLPHPPKRSVLFLGVTAEESGLIGSDYFAHYPTVPEGSMVTAFSTDMPFLLHPLQDIIPRGAEHSSLRGPVEAAALHLGLTVSPDPTPEENFFLRSDQFSFLKKGITGITIDGGFLTGDPTINGKHIDSTWLASVYHTPLDNPDQPFD